MRDLVRSMAARPRWQARRSRRKSEQLIQVLANANDNIAAAEKHLCKTRLGAVEASARAILSERSMPFCNYRAGDCPASG